MTDPCLYAWVDTLLAERPDWLADHRCARPGHHPGAHRCSCGARHLAEAITDLRAGILALGALIVLAAATLAAVVLVAIQRS